MSWGYLVLAPDSFGPRGTKAVCTTPGVVTPNMRVADIAGALDYLATRPDVVKGKIGIIGHSHGGSTVIRSAQKNFGLAQRGLAAGVAYYPGCSPQFDGGIDIPVLLLAGDKDDWTPADRCRTLVSGLSRGGIVDAVYYPNAYHSFDSKVAGPHGARRGGQAASSRLRHGGGARRRGADEGVLREVFALTKLRRLDRSRAARRSGDLLYERPAMVERRSLHSALRAPVEMTGSRTGSYFASSKPICRHSSTSVS